MKKTGLLLLVAVSCASPKDKADTSASLVPDTVKPATVGQTTAGITRRDSAAGQPADRTKTAGSKTSASTKRSVPMRDSVIKPDLNDPRRRLDTAKRPLSSEGSVKLRDSVIRFDLNDPRRTLGRPDSTKRPPL